MNPLGLALEEYAQWSDIEALVGLGWRDCLPPLFGVSQYRLASVEDQAAYISDSPISYGADCYFHGEIRPMLKLHFGSGAQDLTFTDDGAVVTSQNEARLAVDRHWDMTVSVRSDSRNYGDLRPIALRDHADETPVLVCADVCSKPREWIGPLFVRSHMRLTRNKKDPATNVDASSLPVPISELGCVAVKRVPLDDWESHPLIAAIRGGGHGVRYVVKTGHCVSENITKDRADLVRRGKQVKDQFMVTPEALIRLVITRMDVYAWLVLIPADSALKRCEVDLCAV